MAEHNTDFDRIIDRRGTCSLKYDCAGQRGKSEDLLPLWVADMDFKSPSCVEEAISRRLSHGIYGYSEPDNSYFDAVRGWMMENFGWEIDRDEIVLSPGVIFAMAIAINTFTEEGDHVIIQSPVYPHFRDVIEDNNRQAVVSNLRLDDDFRYEIDYEDFEKKIIDNNVKLFLLCNPHNPGGRAWTREELRRLGDICIRHDVLVVSDEIHADIYLHGRHTVYSTLGSEYARGSIVCTSPTKTFNIPGIQIANIVISDPVIRRKFRRGYLRTGYSQLNIFGILAAQAVYTEGREWYEQMLEYIRGNIDYAVRFIQDRIPGLKAMMPDATYLLWVDFKGLGLSRDGERQLLESGAGLWLSDGASFGSGGEHFWRFNLACPRSVLQKALERLERAVQKI